MTLDVYAQLEQRIPRQHGENLDELLSHAREQRPARAAVSLAS
jgi:hypothetical protein